MQWFLLFSSLLRLTLSNAEEEEGEEGEGLCNGYVEYCGKRYSELSYTGAHDSAFVRTSAFNSLFGNQYYDVTVQLDSGVRMLQGQVHASSSGSGGSGDGDDKSGTTGMQLCHTSCAYPGSDFGPVEVYLKRIGDWLARNPREVVTLVWVNQEGFDPSLWARAYEATGLDKYVYTPPRGVLTVQDWPTLGDLITGGTRLVTFLDSGADFDAVPWLLDEFSNIWETAYDVASSSAFSCAIDRPSSSDTASMMVGRKMYLINHFLDYELSPGILIPNATYASITNSYSDLEGSLHAHVQECVRVNGGRPPNFLLVDFFDQGVGSSIATSAIANNVTYKISDAFPGAYSVPGSSHYVSQIPGTTLGPIRNNKSSFGSILGGIMSRLVRKVTQHHAKSMSSATAIATPWSKVTHQTYLVLMITIVNLF